MKSSIFIFKKLVFLIPVSFLFLACPSSVDPHEKENNSSQENPEAGDMNTVKSDSFFWGTWVRMDNGKEYEFLDDSIIYDKQTYSVSYSTNTTLTVNTLGIFNKESDSVIVCNNIPYFRKGGVNLEYSLKVVGFTSDTGRAAASIIRGIRAKGKSKKYTGFESNAESDSEGKLTFKAPTVNDEQTVTITNGEEEVVVSNLKISNSGDYMGTVALVGKDDYNLKITGEISNDQKNNGYLFGNNARAYDMVLTITNVSDNKCTASGCVIEAADPNLILYSSETNLSGFAISTLAGGAAKTINLSLEYGSLSEPYIDTGINVTIKNPFTKEEWTDYIPLRFYKGTIPITIAARNPENNQNAALNGFVIYPDGNNQFFAIKNDSSKSIFVPSFGKEKTYKLVFSGATVTSELAKSTEMYYTVVPGLTSPEPVVMGGSNLASIMTFGGDNHSENTAYKTSESFEAYLRESEIDYFDILLDSEDYYGPDGADFYTITYSSDKGELPSPITVSGGSSLSARQLPELECEGYRFMGWYLGDKKILARDYVIQSNQTFTAKWEEEYKITYVSDHGTVPEPIYLLKDETLSYNELPELTEPGWKFDGWYYNDEKLDTRFYATYPVTENMTVTAKWLELFKITFNSNYGKKVDDIEIGEGETLYSSKLPRLFAKDQIFKGWYTYKECSSDKKLSSIIITSSITLYAKWEDAGMIKIEGGTFTIGNPDDTYNIAHKVTVSDFIICDHEVTEKEYSDFIITGAGSSEDYPAGYIKWYDAIMYCNLRSMAEGLRPCYSYPKFKETDPSDISTWSFFYRPSETNPKDWDGVQVSGDKYSWNKAPVQKDISCDWSANGYRLPTEAEWEFAARGGLSSKGYKYSGSNTLDDVAWYRVDLDLQKHEIKSLSPNELKLYDMSGNVCEWCWDSYEKYENRVETNPHGGTASGVRVMRGGAYNSYEDDCTVYDRSYDNSVTSYPFAGFRLVRNSED